jgi:transcriptional regulator with XRE-family HTH domain
MSLRLARTSLQLSVLSFARLLRVAPRTVSRWELGQAAPPPERRRRISERLSQMLDDATRGRLDEALGLRRRVAPGPLEGTHGNLAHAAQAERAQAEGMRGGAEVVVAASHAGVQVAIDAVIREHAETLDVSARRLRVAVEAVLAEAARAGLDLATIRGCVARAASSASTSGVAGRAGA